ncbi:MAG: transcriptional regulator, TetR family [Acidimicrobiales bacterium]|nr:transcriptional regulator, TetR family [Acidimicrobiales bacterium]
MATLTKTRIIDAAIAVVDEHGFDGLTMRALAEQLGVTATALYYHYAGREELLAGLVEHQTATLVQAAPAEGAWDERARTLITTMVSELDRQPELAVWIITTQARQPPVLQLHEALLAILIDGGFSPRDAIEAKGILFRYVIGHLVLANAPEGQPWRQLPEHYPLLRATGPAHDTIDRVQLFERGLDTILTGLRPEVPRAGGSPNQWVPDRGVVLGPAPRSWHDG